MRLPGALCLYSPARFSPSWQTWLSGNWFDWAVAIRLPKSNVFNGFAGQALQSLVRARALGYAGLALESATSHVNNVMRQQAKAVRQWGIEQGWLNEPQRRQTIKEFDLADRIYVTSRYSRETFLREGMPEHKMRFRQLFVPPRFRPSTTKPSDGRFRVIYVGSISVVKGIPVLLEAFSRLKNPDAELILVGGWSTRGMRLYLERSLRRDSRIRIVQGDPLPFLQAASVYVHPSYQDGLGFAPLEALSCGVPVIVSADTGMKEHVVDGVNGYVVPTGNWEAILERLNHLQEHPLPRSSAA